MDDSGGGSFVAAFRSWQHRLCLVKPPREGHDAAMQRLDEIFEKKLFDSPPKCSSKSLQARLERELELMQVEANALYNWYSDQLTTLFGTDEAPMSPATADEQRQDQSQSCSKDEGSALGISQHLDTQPPFESEAYHLLHFLAISIETNRCQRQSNVFGENQAVSTFKEVMTLQPASENGNSKIDVTDKTADSHYQRTAAKTAVSSKYTRRTAVQELTELVRKHEYQNASRQILGKRKETMSSQSDLPALLTEPPHPVLAPTDRRPENAPRRGNDRQATDSTPRTIDEAQHKAAAEQNLRDLLAGTCPEHVNNDCAWSGPGECRSARCSQAHICKAWWLQAKYGEMNGCSHGGEGVSHYVKGREVNHIKPNCQFKFGSRNKCVPKGGGLCLYGHDNGTYGDRRRVMLYTGARGLGEGEGRSTMLDGLKPC